VKKLIFVFIFSLFLNADLISDANTLISQATALDNSIKLNTFNITTFESFSKDLNEFANTPIEDTENLSTLLFTYVKLSQVTFQLAYDVTNIVDQNSQNASDDYLMTLVILTQTTLRLSDDIGEMADRIGEMADRIGEMADRIVYTEDLIYKYSQMLNETAKYIIDKIPTK